MKFLADENVEQGVVDLLRSRGFDTLYVAEESPTISDDEALQHANDEGRILITNDKDFGELVYLQQKAAHGIILIRSSSEKTSIKAMLVEALLDQHADELERHFTVISEAGARIRPL